MASLYVGNLDPDCTEALLYQKFSPVGNLFNIRICKDINTGRSLGYGFVNYASKTDAEIAMARLNYSLLKNRTIRLMWADKNMKNLPQNGNIFIKNLDSKIDEKSLYDIFGNYGNILSIKLARNEDDSSKEYAFIQFEDEKSAEEAIKCVNAKILFGKVVRVTTFVPLHKRSNTPQLHNVYINNLHSNTTDNYLFAMCKEFGEIDSVKGMIDEGVHSKCFGCVSFINPDSAKQAIKELNGKVVLGRKLIASNHLQNF